VVQSKINTRSALVELCAGNVIRLQPSNSVLRGDASCDDKLAIWKAETA
jgi:hypothetical protein